MTPRMTSLWRRAVFVTVMAASQAARADSSLVASASAIAHQLGAPAKSVLVVASRLTTDVTAPRGDDLAVRIGSLVAAALGNDAIAETHAMPLADARRRLRSAAVSGGRLVYVDVRIGNGELRVTADAYPASDNAWDRARGVVAPPLGHAYVHVPVSAEVRAYLEPLHLERAEAHKFTHGMGPLLALACGDFDGVGGNDLVLVSEKEVAWGYLQAGRFVAVRRVAASAVGKRAPVSFREPIAAAELVPTDTAGALYVAWGDRVGAKLGPDLVATARLVGLPVSAGADLACLVPNAAHGGFDDARVSCDDGKVLAGVAPPSLGQLVTDEWRALDLVDADGHESHVTASRDVAATLHLTRAPLRTSAPEVLTVADVGAGIALSDLDQDGVPDIVTTLPSGEDALVISSWRGGSAGKLEPRLRIGAPAGVDAVAVCPAEANAAPSVVAAVGGEIWLVR